MEKRMVKVEVRLADGAYHEFSGEAGLHARLLALQAEGFQGRELVARLLPNDWSAPPTVVTLFGSDAAGASWRQVITCS
jgi:hypothetical protein